MSRKKSFKKLQTTIIILFLISTLLITHYSQETKAETYAEQLAKAILADNSTLISASYTDTSTENKQSTVLSSLGTMIPTQGNTFLLLSTGLAGENATTDGETPGSERGNWFGAQDPWWWQEYDEAQLTLELQVPPEMGYLYYDTQFFTVEYPDYVGSIFNDELSITVDSPSKGETTNIIDVNSGDFVFESYDIPGTGFDLFAKEEYTSEPTDPDGVDWVSTTPAEIGADAGATALVGRANPVTPNETITVTINIQDAGDNQFDSAAFIDNLRFVETIGPQISSKKRVEDLNGKPPQPGDTLEYTITISNENGTATQKNNPGNEFEDPIPEHTTYVTGSAQATSGTINYEDSTNQITWNGEIPSHSSIKINYQVEIKNENYSTISNQGTVYWDNSNDGTDQNNATELTDDPTVDDGIDQDNDGKTGDDDPTNISKPPSTLTENFSNDKTGEKATENFDGKKWIETTNEKEKSIFETAGSYYYSTEKSFKTKIRKESNTQYWNYYTLSNLNTSIEWWETTFICGENSEPADLHLEFKNQENQTITHLKIEYIKTGNNNLTPYQPKIYYQQNASWKPLNSSTKNGHLKTEWYKIKIEKNGNQSINYTLYQNKQKINSKTGNALDAPFTNLTKIEWNSTYNPIQCPIIFWDEHTVGLT